MIHDIEKLHPLLRGIMKGYSDEFPLLEGVGLYASDISGDGDCLFHALSDQVCISFVIDSRSHVRLFQTDGNPPHSSTAMRTITLRSGKMWLNVSHVVVRKNNPVLNFRSRIAN